MTLTVARTPVAGSPPASRSAPSAPGAAPPRVFVVEDHELFAEILVHALHGHGVEADMAAVESVESILAQAASFAPDVVLLDADLGAAVGPGVPLIEPLADLGAAVLILTASDDPIRHAECVEAGAQGVVTKDEPLERLVTALDTVASEGTLLAEHDRQDLLAQLRMRRLEERTRLAPFERLTPREAAVLRGLMKGRRAAELAELSYVSIDTVRSQIRAILVKLGVTSQLAAVAQARRAGWR